MKRIIATILATLMLMATTYAKATFEYNGGKIGNFDIDASVQGKVSSYLYNGNKYSFDVNDEDFKKLNQLFSDQNLTNSLESFNEPITGNMSEYPKGGKYTVKGLHDNVNKYSVTLEFSFDSEGVLFSEILINSDAVNHMLRQGYYTYNSKDIYSQIKGILDEYAEIEEEKTINDKYEIKSNEVKISDLKILYTATFSDSELSMNGDNKWTWGICSYKYEQGKMVTKAYLSLLEDDKGTKYFLVSDIGLQKNNTIYFSGNTDILFYGSENFGKENTKSDMVYSFKLQFNVSDNTEIESLVYSQLHKITNALKSININMNKYIGDKTLPKISSFQFSSENNVAWQEEKKEDSKEDTKTDEKIEKKEQDKKEEQKDEKKQVAEPVADKEKVEEEEKAGDGSPARVYNFEELTGLAIEDVDHIIIRNGANGIEYATAYNKIISEIYAAINTKTFNVYIGDGDGWSYEISFVDKNKSVYTYTIPKGIVIKAKDGLTYRTSDEEELKNVVRNAYNLMDNDCSDWSADYITQAKDLGFLESVTDILYKKPITREKFCEIIYNMLDKAMDIEWKTGFHNSFTDTSNEKVFSLFSEGIVNGKGRYIFAPNDYLTREEAATIINRVIYKFISDITVEEKYFEYDDINDVSEWAADSVQIISNLGVMNGVGGNKFAPKETYTTEQAIATVIRLYKKVDGITGMKSLSNTVLAEIQ